MQYSQMTDNSQLSISNNMKFMREQVCVKSHVLSVHSGKM